MENINWLSLILATLVPMVVGFIYYHKALFGNAWMESIGLTEEKAKEANMGKMMLFMVLSAFLIAFFMLNFTNGPGQEGIYDTAAHGAYHGVLVTLFLVLPLFISNGLAERRPWKNIWINTMFWGICICLMGAILDAMNHFPNELPPPPPPMM